MLRHNHIIDELFVDIGLGGLFDGGKKGGVDGISHGKGLWAIVIVCHFQSGLCLVCQGILFRNEPKFCFLATASTVDHGWLRRGRDNNGEDNEWHWNADAAPNEWRSSTRHDDSIITLMTPLLHENGCLWLYLNVIGRCLLLVGQWLCHLIALSRRVGGVCHRCRRRREQKPRGEPSTARAERRRRRKACTTNKQN